MSESVLVNNWLCRFVLDNLLDFLGLYFDADVLHNLPTLFALVKFLWGTFRFQLSYLADLLKCLVTVWGFPSPTFCPWSRKPLTIVVVPQLLLVQVVQPLRSDARLGLGGAPFLSLSTLRLFGDSCDFAEAPASPLFSGPCAPLFAHPSTGHLIAWPPLHLHFLIHSICLDSVGHSGPLGSWLPPFFPSPPPLPPSPICLDPVGHSGPLGLWLPPFPLTSLGSVGHSGPLGLWLPPPVSFTLTTSTFIHCLDPVGHSGPLGPWLPPCLLSLFITQLLHHCLDSVGHSGPLDLWRPPFLILHSPYILFHHCLDIPAHSVCGYLPLIGFYTSPGISISHCHNPVGHSGPLGYWLCSRISHHFFPTTLSHIS